MKPQGDKLLSQIKDEVVLMVNEFKNRLRDSVSDFKKETADLKVNLSTEVEKFKGKLRL